MSIPAMPAACLISSTELLGLFGSKDHVLIPPHSRRRTVVANRGAITACVILAVIMQALDTTIANVALPYIQGSVSASADQINWVLTSYIVAAAIMTPPSGFLAASFGRKNVLLTAIVGFVVASVLCGLAQSCRRSSSSG